MSRTCGWSVQSLVCGAQVVKPIIIIGGGLAGLTLGVALRRNGLPVTVIEAGHYPRHRVCGEFISGSGAKVLRHLGIEQALEGRLRMARDAAFFSSTCLLSKRSLPDAAYCVSRTVLDTALSEMFQDSGGELRTGERCRESISEEGIVCAMGRRARAATKDWRWIGLKAHASNVRLTADLEMHLTRNSYVGLCQLPDGETNICGLFRRRLNEPLRGRPEDELRGKPRSPLFHRLKEAQFDRASVCAVAGLSLRSEAFDTRQCRIGDALTMIPPITGNGMSMAFESAQCATARLVEYARGEISWNEATERIAEALRMAFARRLRCAAIIQRILFSAMGIPAARLFLRLERTWNGIFALTR